MILYAAGDPARAVACYEAAVRVTDPEVDPELALSPRHNLLLCFCDLDRAAEARALLDTTRPLYRRLGLPIAPLWLHWAEGKVAAAAGEDDSALEHLRAARDGYLERRLEYDAALVCLDLTRLHLHRGETTEVRRLAEQIARAFARRGVHREAARAVRMFEQAALAQAVTLELLTRTRAALLRAQRTVSSTA
jgi:tetratricopeptide (TPR) repeat protein